MPIDLIIFDCDGVLIDSEPIAARVLAECAGELGLMLTAEDCIERFTGISMASVIDALAADLGRPLPADFAFRVQQRDFAAFAAELKPVNGVQALLAALNKVRVCVASSGASAKIRFNLGGTGLLPWFEPHLFSAEMVTRGKPAPDLFLFAAESMGVSPQRCLVIEDSVAGVYAARAAGMRALGFTGGGHCRPAHGDRLLQAGAHAICATMTELAAVLRAEDHFPPQDRGDSSPSDHPAG